MMGESMAVRLGHVGTALEPLGRGWGQTNLAAPSEHQDTLSLRTRTVWSR